MSAPFGIPMIWWVLGGVVIGVVGALVVDALGNK
jgi:hypothetical protein